MKQWLRRIRGAIGMGLTWPVDARRRRLSIGHSEVEAKELLGDRG